MATFVLLFTLFGCGLAFMPNTEYTYKYEGRIGIGIPEIRNRVAGAGIRANVVLQGVDRERTMVQLQNVEVGEYLGDVICELRQAMPIRYSRLSGHAKVLEEPFEVNLSIKKGNVMKVSKTDIEWVTNLRKSVATLFVIDPIRSGFAAGEEESPLKSALEAKVHRLPEWYAIREPSIFGDCYSDYSLIPQQLTPIDGEQESGGENPVTMPYSMKRTINFNRCDEKVILQQTGVGNGTLFGANQFGDITSRSSVMTARLNHIGNVEEPFRIQDLRVEGHFILNPFGMKQDKLMSISNQTLHLVSMKPVTAPFVLPPSTKTIKTWLMEVASPFGPRHAGSPSWINFYNLPDPKYSPVLPESVATGIFLDRQHVDTLKATLDAMLEEAASLMMSVSPVPTQISPFSTNEAKIVTHLESSFRVVRGIDLQTLEALFEQYSADHSPKAEMKLKLFIDVCSASGTGAPWKMLLNQIEKKRITPERIASIFFTLPNNLLSIPLIEDLTRYAKTLDIKESPFLASTVWINLATTLNRICLSSEKRNYTVPVEVFGKADCNPSEVVNDILPFFRTQLQNAQEHWQQVIILRAIGNLGAHEAFTYVAGVARNRNMDAMIRETAIYSLTSKSVSHDLREAVFRSLMPIVEDITQDDYLRQAAVSALLTWRPAPSWWQKMAVTTWREPSPNMAAFVFFLLEGVSQSTDPMFHREAKIAQFVLPLAKPFSPTWRYSYDKFYGRYNPHKIVSTNQIFGILKDKYASFPREILSFLMTSYGSLRFNLFAVAYSSEFAHMPYMRKMLKDILGYVSDDSSSVVRSSENRRSEKELSQMMKRMKSVKDESDSVRYSTIFFSIFDNLEIFAPVSKEAVRKLLEGDASRFLKSLSDGKMLHLTKFLNPAPIEVLYPSEIGLPFFAKLTAPTVNGGEGSATLRVDGDKFHNFNQLFSAKEITLNVTTNYKFATKTITTLRALVPWSEHLVAAGVETMKNVNLPVNMTVHLNFTTPQRNVSFHIVPIHKPAFPAVHMHTIPFVVRKSMWPGDPPKDFLQYEPISFLGDKKGVEERELKFSKPYTGLEGALQWEGDVSYPFTWGNLLTFIYHPDKFSELVTSPSVRMWASSLHVNMDASTTKEFHPSISFGMTESHLKKKSVFAPLAAHNNYDYLVIGNLLLNGTENRYFEWTLMANRTNTSSTFTNSMFFSTGRSPLPAYDNNPSAYCLHLDLKYPPITSIDTLRQVLRQRVQIDAKGRLDGGVSCQPSLAQFEGSLKLSEERRQRLSKELETVCDCDPSDPMAVFKTSPVYDELNFNVQYKEPVIPTLQNFTYHIYDIIRGWSFPHVYFNYLNVKNPSGRLEVTGKRYVGEKRWTINSKIPTEDIVFDNFGVPQLFDQLIPAGGLSHGSRLVDSPSIIFDAQLSDQCTIDIRGHVLTFDHFWYTYTPEFCPAYVTRTRDDEFAPTFMTGLDERTKKFIGLVGAGSNGLTIYFNSSKLEVDGKPLELKSTKTPIIDRAGHYFADVLTVKNYVEVTVPGNFTVRLSDDKIWIIPEDTMQHKYAGLCGNYDKSKVRELIGPKQCKYYSGSLFAYAWTSYLNAGCDYQHYKRENERVKRYQRSCTKGVESSQALSLIKPSAIPDDCLEYVYKIVKERSSGVLCVSQTPAGMCYPTGCKKVYSFKRMMMYDCWSEQFAPDELLKNLKRGYLINKLDVRPEVVSSFKTESVYLCAKV